MLTEAQSSVVRQFAQFLLILSEVFYKMVPFDTINLFKQLFVSSPKTLGSPIKMSSAFPPIEIATWTMYNNLQRILLTY